ncbi:MAG: hypothetical protein RL220_1313, partial [Bacteroidota bacterium]
MQIKQTNLDGHMARLTVEVTPADYQEKVENAIKRYRKSATLPGFRPGHVPVNLIKKRFGKSFLAEEISALVQDAISQHIRENNIQVLGSPIPADSDEVNGNWDEPGDFSFAYEMGLAPALELNLDKSRSYTWHKLIVDDTLIDRQVKDYARRYGKLSEPEESASDDLLMGVFTEIDANGNAVEGGINHKSTISIEYVKDEPTKKALSGLKKGDTVDLDPHKLSANHEELAQMLGITHHDLHHLNNHVRFSVDEIKRMTPHEMNQELFDKLYGADEVKSEEEMRERVRKELEAMFARDEQYLFKRQLMHDLLDNTNVELPDAFLKRFIRMTNEKEVTEEQVEHDYPAYARMLKWQLIEGDIIRKHEIRVSPEEARDHVRASLRERYAQYGIPVEDAMLESLVERTFQ